MQRRENDASFGNRVRGIHSAEFRNFGIERLKYLQNLESMKNKLYQVVLRFVTFTHK
jgi:hypothetical protein